MSVTDVPPRAASRIDGDARRGWRQRLSGRPFAGALLMILAGTELLAVMWPAPPIRLAAGAALGGPVQQLLAAGLVLCGLLTWIHPVRRTEFSTAAALLALCALLTPDIGGFLGGTLLGAAGASLAFAWVPAGPPHQREPDASAGSPDAALALAVADEGAVVSSTAVAG